MLSNECRAELPDEGVTVQAGDRLFDVSAQGKDILVDFDVFEEAGKRRLSRHVVPTLDFWYEPCTSAS